MTAGTARSSSRTRTGRRRSPSWTDGPTRHVPTLALAALLAVGAAAAPARAQHAWLAGGRLTPQATAAIVALRDADARGLRPADYDAHALAAAASAVASGAADDAARERFDAALTRSVARLLAHLHAGRVRPGAVGFHLPEAHARIDFTALARGVSRAPDARAAIAAAEPPYAGYASLVRALARYRALAADPALRPPAAPRRALREGAAYPDAAALRRLLVALGDLAPDGMASGADTVYDASLAAAVRAFQQRHGLDPDGVVGPATTAELRRPLADRVSRIELSLERWRWMPDIAPPRYAVVNIPAFRLAVFEDDPAGARPLVRMKVIVGRAHGPRHTTPPFTGVMREVVFRPYWDVPLSIARAEVVPRIRRDHGYLDRNDFEIVDDAERWHPATGANLSRVTAGTLRIRQRPGGGNALGPVKFVFPNAFNVYLHGTPATQLFESTRRDFSHGCIRVEDPAALAEFVLRGQPGWDRTAIDSAMGAERTRRVTIARPVTVYVLYTTATANAEGVVRFHPDIYGHDAALARVLTAEGYAALTHARAEQRGR